MNCRVLNGLIAAGLTFAAAGSASAIPFQITGASTYGVSAGSTVNVTSLVAPRTFDAGLFSVDFLGFSDSCRYCGSLSGAVQARVSLVRAPNVSVPEPAALSLLGAGLLAIGFARRRRRDSQRSKQPTSVTARP